MPKFGYGLVRDKNGKPKIDGDPKDMPPQLVAMLSPEEREELGIWAGPMIRDADGIKRGELVKETRKTAQVKALDDLRAASEFFVGKRVFRLKDRRDIPAGTLVKLTST